MLHGYSALHVGSPCPNSYCSPAAARNQDLQHCQEAEMVIDVTSEEMDSYLYSPAREEFHEKPKNAPLILIHISHQVEKMSSLCGVCIPH